jgi:hypothetical protein
MKLSGVKDICAKGVEPIRDEKKTANTAFSMLKMCAGFAALFYSRWDLLLSSPRHYNSRLPKYI